MILDRKQIDQLPEAFYHSQTDMFPVFQQGITKKIPRTLIGGMNTLTINSSVTAVDNTRYLCDTSEGGFEISLDPNSKPGLYIEIIDTAGAFDINSVIVRGNGRKIYRVLEDLNLNTKSIQISLIYIHELYGWHIDFSVL